MRLITPGGGLWIMLLLCLAGCGPSPRQDAHVLWREYSARVARALDQPVNVARQPVPALPSGRALLLEEPAHSLGMLEFLRLQRCALNTLIADHNSSLGRQQRGSARLAYQVRFLQAAPACDQVLSRDAEQKTLRLALRQAVQSKRDAMPRYLWNVLWPEAELQTFASPHAPPLSPEQAGTVPTAVQEALAHWRQVLNQPGGLAEEGALAALERHNAALASSKRLGALLHALSLATDHLKAVAASVDARLARRPVCLQPRPTAQAEILRAVLVSQYLEGVQPYLAALDRQARVLLPAVAALKPLPPGELPPDFTAWLVALDDANPASVPARFRAATVAHQQAWQRLLAQCGLSPSPA